MILGMKIHSTQFIKGVVGEEAILYDGTPQIAFIGRSNVGKSSTLNAILDRKKLVKTGKTPGKTKEINFFEIIDEHKSKIYFVDLPGYGYAKISKSERQKLSDLIRWYITHPTADTALICLIIDAKVGMTDFDIEVLETLQQNNKSYIIGVNKIDKVNQKTKNKMIKDVDALGINTDDVIMYSAAKKKHVNKLINAISRIVYS